MRELAGGKQMRSVWGVLPPGTTEKVHGKHPTQKPIALMKQILLASTKRGDLVLDPFVGSGTAVVAAVELDRHAVGIELESSSVEVAVKRIADSIRTTRQGTPEASIAGKS